MPIILKAIKKTLEKRRDNKTPEPSSVTGEVNASSSPGPEPIESTVDVETQNRKPKEENDSSPDAVDDSSSEDEESPNILRLGVKAILPFLFFNLLTTQGRREYVDLLMEDPLGSIITWIPFILILALASVRAEVAIWVAFGISCVIILLQYYHHTYKPIFPAFYWIPCGTWFGYLGLGIAYAVDPFNYKFISPVTVSLLTGVCLLSLITRVPFTIQFAKMRVPEQVAKSPWFYQLNVFLTRVWLLLFAVMAASTWIAFGLDFDHGSAGEIVLGIVIPIVVPLLGIRLLTPILVERYRSRNPPPHLTEETPGSTPMEIKSGDDHVE